MRARVTGNPAEGYKVNGESVVVLDRCHRYVGVVGDLILKVDHKPWGLAVYKQVEREKRIWPSIKKEDRKYFAPILWQGKVHGCHYLLQQKVFCCGNEGNMEILDRLDKEYRLVDVGQTYNLVWKENGDPLIYDWGIAKGPRKKKKPRAKKAGA